MLVKAPRCVKVGAPRGRRLGNLKLRTAAVVQEDLFLGTVPRRQLSTKRKKDYVIDSYLSISLSISLSAYLSIYIYIYTHTYIHI